MAVNFDNDPYALGFYEPTRFEADIHDCEVDGEIPTDLDGSFYRSCVDRRYPQRMANDIPFNSDGMVDMFRFRSGHVDFRTRYIRTPRYVAERKARRALTGTYRNRYTNDPAAANISLNTGNTTPMVHAGKLFSMKESNHPMLMDPHTLKTIGEYDFEGKLTATSFTAHPKIDPVTGEMLAFSYEAKGDLTNDLAVHTIDANGVLQREIWLKAPVVSMMHDWAVSQKHFILPTTSMMGTSIERLKQGDVHFEYDKTVKSHIGILHRDGDPEDVRWFTGRTDQSMVVHTTNAITDGNRVILDSPIAGGNFNPQFANRDGSPFDNEARKNLIRRWTFNLNSASDGWEEEILFNGLKTTSFIRIDDRYISQPFRYGFVLVNDSDLPFDEARGGNLKGRINNSWYRLDHATGRINKFFVGDTGDLHEPQFVPRHNNAPEGDGYIIGVSNNFAEMKSELVIVDAQHLEEGAIARVKLPFRLHMQVHGWWSASSTLPFDFDVDPDFPA